MKGREADGSAARYQISKGKREMRNASPKTGSKNKMWVKKSMGALYHGKDTPHDYEDKEEVALERRIKG